MPSMDDDKLSSSLQESLLTLLAFNEPLGRIAANMVTSDLFEPPYRDIAEKVLMYRNRFGEAPGVSHLDDLFDFILEGKDDSKRAIYQELLSGMLAQSESLNAVYVSQRISEFIRRQTLKGGVLKAADRYQQGGDTVADDVERILGDALKQRVLSQDPGTFMNDASRVLAFMDNPPESWRLGIKELDRFNLGPTRKEQLLFVAPRKKGKTWFLTHVAKHARVQRAKVMHFTLEMSEARCSQRYLQSFFAIAKRRENFPLTELEIDQLGNLTGLATNMINPRMSYDDPEIRRKVERRMGEAGTLLAGLCVKEFPSGAMTIARMNAHLDYMDSVHHFQPDIIIVDYPDLMEVDAKNLRVSLGQIYVNLRGVAGERNAAMVVPTQSNRESSTAKVVNESHVSEDISKIATADLVLTYSQTDAEKALGLARLFVSNARNDRDRFIVLVTQAYDTGQFALNSAPINSQYNTMLKRAAGIEEDDE